MANSRGKNLPKAFTTRAKSVLSRFRVLLLLLDLVRLLSRSLKCSCPTITPLLSMNDSPLRYVNDSRAVIPLTFKRAVTLLDARLRCP